MECPADCPCCLCRLHACIDTSAACAIDRHCLLWRSRSDDMRQMPDPPALQVVAYLCSSSCSNAAIAASCQGCGRISSTILGRRSSLGLANDNDLRTIAFPAISCGVYGYPLNEAAEVGLLSLNTLSTQTSGWLVLSYRGSACLLVKGSFTSQLDWHEWITPLK